MLDKNILKSLIDKQRQESFVNPEKHSDEDALGILIAQYFEWDALAILKTMYNALEDANFHTENKTVMALIKKVERGENV